MTEHIPVPSEHAPVKETYLNDENEMTVQEVGSSEAWITMDGDNTMVVRQ